MEIFQRITDIKKIYSVNKKKVNVDTFFFLCSKENNHIFRTNEKIAERRLAQTVYFKMLFLEVFSNFFR